jgi:hypothetical protein
MCTEAENNSNAVQDRVVVNTVKSTSAVCAVPDPAESPTWSGPSDSSRTASPGVLLVNYTSKENSN